MHKFVFHQGYNHNLQLAPKLLLHSLRPLSFSLCALKLLRSDATASLPFNSGSLHRIRRRLRSLAVDAALALSDLEHALVRKGIPLGILQFRLHSSNLLQKAENRNIYFRILCSKDTHSHSNDGPNRKENEGSSTHLKLSLHSLQHISNFLPESLRVARIVRLPFCQDDGQDWMGV